MRHYTQLTREQRYQIYALKKTVISKKILLMLLVFINRQLAGNLDAIVAREVTDQNKLMGRLKTDESEKFLPGLTVMIGEE